MRNVIFLMMLFSMNACATSNECSDDASQAQLDNCASAEFAQADKELRNVIREMESMLSEDAEIRQANSLWFKFRDAHCESVTNIYSGGSVRNYLLMKCKSAMTRSRIEMLNSDYSDTINIITQGAP